MAGHDWWHLLVLGSTLFGAAGLVLVTVGTLFFDEPPPGLDRLRPGILALVGLTAFLLLVEWLGVH